MDEEGLVKARIMKKMQSLQRKRGKTILASLLLCTLVPSITEFTWKPTGKGACVTYFSKHKKVRK